MFSCEYCEIFKKTYAEEHLRATVSHVRMEWNPCCDFLIKKSVNVWHNNCLHGQNVIIQLYFRVIKLLNNSFLDGIAFNKFNHLKNLANTMYFYIFWYKFLVLHEVWPDFFHSFKTSKILSSNERLVYNNFSSSKYGFKSTWSQTH